MDSSKEIIKETKRHLEYKDNLYMYGFRARIIYPLVPLGQMNGKEISVLSYSKEEWEQFNPSLFYMNVMKDGIRLF